MEHDKILYRLGFDDLNGHRLNVHLTIPVPDPKGQKLFLPAWIPGSYLLRDFSRQIESIQAFCQDRPVAISKTANHEWHCQPCEGALVIKYVVYAWDLSVRSAHVDDSHAFFNGTSVFLGVAGQEQKACLLYLNAPAQKPDWKVYTSLPEAKNHPKAAPRHGFGMYEAPNYDALIDHPFELGTPQYIAFEVHGATHELVFTGVIPHLDLARIAADIQKICAAQIELFEPDSKAVPFLDSSDRYVFMTMVTENGYGGLEHRSSTALMAARADLPTIGSDPAIKSNGYQNFLGLVSHEYFHTWHVKRIKPAAFAPYDLLRENHTKLLWVFEGFTSYYDELMLWRSGVIDQKTFLARQAKVISMVHRTGGRHKQSTAESSFDTWTRFYKQDENSPNALVSYYSKGALVALALDLHIQYHSKKQRSLDDVMRLMWQRYGRDFYLGNAIGVPEDAMPALIKEATGIDCADLIQRCAEGREDPPLAALFALHQIQLRPKSQTSALACTLNVQYKEQNNALHIATVYEHGVAHAAGLSAGDIIVALDGLRVQTQKQLEQLLSAYSPGQTVHFHVFRRDELRCYPVILAALGSEDFELIIQHESTSS